METAVDKLVEKLIETYETINTRAQVESLYGQTSHSAFLNSERWGALRMLNIARDFQAKQSVPKRGEPIVGRTADEPHRPLVCYVCGRDFPITFNFCHAHKEEYERLKKENKDQFTKGWNSALNIYPPKDANEKPKDNPILDFMHFLCTGEATPQIQELFAPLVSNKTSPVPTERNHRPATLGTSTRREGT